MEVNKIYNMDCIEGMRGLKDKSIDLIFTDLPYAKTQNSWDNIIPFDSMWEQVERVIKDNGAIIFFGQDKFTAKLMLSNEKLHRYNLIWDKQLTTGFLNSNKMPLRSHEDIIIFYKKAPTYNPQCVKGERTHSRGKGVGRTAKNMGNNHTYGNYILKEETNAWKYPKSIWSYQKLHPSKVIHPTQKPLELCREIISTYSNEGDVVLDFCCGSGTIPLAAKQLHRNYIGFDNGICENKKMYTGKPWAEVAQDRLDCSV